MNQELIEQLRTAAQANSADRHISKLFTEALHAIVRLTHRPSDLVMTFEPGYDEGPIWCEHCNTACPCLTIQALDGEA